MTRLISSRLLVRRRNSEPMRSASAIPTMRIRGDGAQTWLSASIIAAAVFGGVEATTAGSIQMGLYAERHRPHRIRVARLPSVWLSGDATSGNHKSGSKLAIDETKQKTW